MIKVLKDKIFILFPLFVFVFTISFYSPLERYFSNSTGFWFTFYDVIYVALMVSVIVFLIMSALLLLLSVSSQKRAALLLLSISFCWYVQGLYLNPDLRVLDGVSINWSDYAREGVVSTLFWFFICCFSVVPFLSKKISYSGLVNISFVVFLMVLSGLIVSAYDSNKGLPDQAELPHFVSNKGLYELSNKGNTVVFVLDAFDAETFKELLEDDDDIKQWFSDFIWYPDTLAGATRTKLSIPLLLSDIPYLEPVSYYSYKQAAYKNSELLKATLKFGVDAGVYTPGTYASPSLGDFADNVVLDKSVVGSFYEFAKLFYRFTAFTYMPQFVKDYFWIYTGDFELLRSSPVAGLSPYKMDDVDFYKNLKVRNLALNSNDRAFRFIHMMGPHAPFIMNDKGERVNKSSEREQAKGSLYIVRHYMGQMNNLGVYDAANIVITSDHGLRGREQNALLLVKKTNGNRSDGLHISEERVSHHLLNKCLISAVVGSSVAECLSLSSYSSDDVRHFYIEQASNNFNIIVQLATNQHASDASALYETGVLNDLFSDLNIKYSIGDSLDFMSIGSGNIYALKGFSKNEGGHTWTDGGHAVMVIPLTESVSESLMLNMNFDVFGNEQRVIIKINENMVFDGDVSGRSSPMKVFIPKYIVDDEIYLEFLFPGATSPHALGQSDDKRVLALAFKSILFEKTNFATTKIGTAYSINEMRKDIFRSSGWSGQEPTHRWTEGPKAAIQFRIQDFAERDLVLRLNAFGYLGGGLPHQKVGVVVNGAQVAEWLVADVAEHTAVIPANLIGDDGLINLSFDISDPRAPCDYSESTDCRKLGLAVRELVVDYVQ